jgi:DNA polymerase epsilon subunit 2
LSFNKRKTSHVPVQQNCEFFLQNIFRFVTYFSTHLFTDNKMSKTLPVPEDGSMRFAVLGFPPAETSATTRAYFGATNFFGGPAEKSVKTSEKLARIEQLNPDAMFVFIADVWLDSAAVQERLRRLLAGYSEMPPTAFVLCGNFLSLSSGSSGYAESLKVMYANNTSIDCKLQNSIIGTDIGTGT